jgi:hypothetical protein
MMKRLLLSVCLGLLVASGCRGDNRSQQLGDSRALEFVGYAYTIYGNRPTFVLYDSTAKERSQWLGLGNSWHGYMIASFDRSSETLTVGRDGEEITLGLRRSRDDLWESPVATTLSPKAFVSLVESRIVDHSKSLIWKGDEGIEQEDLDGRVFLKIFNERIVWVMGYRDRRRTLPYGQEAFWEMDDSPKEMSMDDMDDVAWIPGIWSCLGNYVSEASGADRPITTQHSPKDVIAVIENAAFGANRRRSDFGNADLYLVLGKTKLTWLAGYHSPKWNGGPNDPWKLRAQMDDSADVVRLDTP